MLKNPFVKFDGQPIKGYLFPKYTGKYMFQTQKQYQSRSFQKTSPLSPKKSVSDHKSTDQSQYKNIKAEADYYKKIHQVKRRLECEIKKYNREKRSIQGIPKRFSLSLQNPGHTIKLEEICVNIRRQQSKKALQNPELQLINRNKQRFKRKNSVKYLLKNKAWIRRNLKTQEQTFLKQHKKAVSEAANISSETRENYISAQNKNELKLTSINRRQNISEIKQSIGNRASIRYELGQDPSKIALEGEYGQYYSLKLDGQCKSNRSSINQSKIKQMRIIELQGSTKSLQKRLQNRRKIVIDHKQSNQAQIFLKGWDSHQEKYPQQQENVNLQYGMY